MASPAPAAIPPAASAYPLKAFSAIGSSFAQSSRLPELGWNEAQIGAFLDGVRAALHGKGYPFDETANEVSREMGRRLHELEERAKQQTTSVFTQPGRLEQFMKEARKRLHLQQTDSGLGYRIDEGHGGLRPRPNDTVVFTCIATLADGSTPLPQLSFDRFRVKMTDLLPGFLEGLQMMTVDSKAIFVMPPALTFGEGDWPLGVDRRAPILFQVTLHEVIAGEETP